MLGNDQVVVTQLEKRSEFPYNRVIALEYRSPGNMILLDHIPDIYQLGAQAETYDPALLIDQAASPPKRVNTVLPDWLYHTRSTIQPLPQSSFRMEFDQPHSESDWNWPSTLGSGWYPPEGSRQWMSDKLAVIETCFIRK